MNNPIIKSFLGFNKGILSLPTAWQAWMGLLILSNLIMPLFFLGTLEAKVVLAGFAVSLSLMLILFAKYGFVKLLGIGHSPWLLTVPWLASRIGDHTGAGLFYYWLLSVVVIDGLSLLIDVVDVARYWNGERQESVSLDVESI